jgi:hypothetical protein
MLHAFKPGDRVLFNPKAGPDFDFFTLITPYQLEDGEVWEVERLLPEADGVLQYHIQSCHGGWKCMANQLQPRPAL